MDYNEEQKSLFVAEVCRIIREESLSTKKAVKKAGISRSAFYDWLAANPSFADKYARAKDDQIEDKFESIEDDYMANPERDPETGKIDPAWVQLQRLKIDAKKWELSKLKPKKYGDKLDIDHTSKGEKLIFTPIDLDVKKNDSTDEDFEA